MYLNYWEQSKISSSNVPDSRFFYKPRADRESPTRLTYLYTYQHSTGIVVGSFGSDKILLGFILPNDKPANRENILQTAFVSRGQGFAS